MDRGASRSCGRFPPVGATARRRVYTLLAGCVLLLAATRSPAVAAPAATLAPTGAACEGTPLKEEDATRESAVGSAEGRRMKEIAATLQLSTRTVETHKYDMMRALGVQSTAELVRYAIHLGLVARYTGPPGLSGPCVRIFPEPRSGILPGFAPPSNSSIILRMACGVSHPPIDAAGTLPAQASKTSLGPT